MTRSTLLVLALALSACESVSVFCNPDVVPGLLGTAIVEGTAPDASTTTRVSMPDAVINCTANTATATDYTCRLSGTATVSFRIQFARSLKQLTLGASLSGGDITITDASWTASDIVQPLNTQPRARFTVITGLANDAGTSLTAVIHGEICGASSVLFLTRVDAVFE